MRLGIDGSVGVGLFSYYGIGLRTEFAVKREGYVLGRLSYMSGAAAVEGRGFDAGIATIGYRGYNGPVYAGIEGGVIVAHQGAYSEFDDDVQPATTDALPLVFAGVGTKLGAAELGLSISAPLFTIGLSLGFDLNASPSERPRRLKVSKARAASAQR